MSRPVMLRKVCCLPENNEFYPSGGNGSIVTLTVDEYEAVRLIDKENFTQKECSEFMQVSRSTVQLIYETARRKLADALVFGAVIRIDGGDYKLCDCKTDKCSFDGCRKHKLCNK